MDPVLLRIDQSPVQLRVDQSPVKLEIAAPRGAQGPMAETGIKFFASGNILSEELVLVMPVYGPIALSASRSIARVQETPEADWEMQILLDGVLFGLITFAGTVSPVAADGVITLSGDIPSGRHEIIFRGPTVASVRLSDLSVNLMSPAP